MRYLSPALVLFFLSPMIGELLSSSAPPAEFFNPLGFIMLAVLYGGGAILIRELVFRWGKGWPSLLVLAVAYGIAEEGLMCKSFFDPGWMDVGLLGTYGRWLGVNWVWTFELTIFHAAFSIVIPITLVNLLFPARRQERWLGRWGFVVLAMLWVINGILIFRFISPYRPPVLHYGIALAVTIGLIALARRLPQSIAAARPSEKKAPRPVRLGVLAFGGTFALFLLAWVVPQTKVHPMVVNTLMVALAAAIVWTVSFASCESGFSDRHKLALVSGALCFFILILAPVREWAANQPDNPTGMSLVGLTALAFLLWLGRRVKRREKSATNQEKSVTNSA
jgi:hypothetical protein